MNLTRATSRAQRKDLKLRHQSPRNSLAGPFSSISLPHYRPDTHYRSSSLAAKVTNSRRRRTFPPFPPVASRLPSPLLFVSAASIPAFEIISIRCNFLFLSLPSVCALRPHRSHIRLASFYHGAAAHDRHPLITPIQQRSDPIYYYRVSAHLFLCIVYRPTTHTSSRYGYLHCFRHSGLLVLRSASSVLRPPLSCSDRTPLSTRSTPRCPTAIATAI